MGDFIKTKPLNKKLKLLNFSSVCTVWARCAGSLLEPPPNQPSAQEEPEDGLRQPKQPRLPEPDRLGHGERTLSVWWITAETPVGSHRSFHLPTLKTCCDMIQNRTHAHLLHNSCHENMTGATIKDTSSVPACPGNWLFFSLFFFYFYFFKINCEDDHGVLKGNWTNDFKKGVHPSTWTGSGDVLKKWAESNYSPVRYGQCWVFAAVMCTGDLKWFQLSELHRDLCTGFVATPSMSHTFHTAIASCSHESSWDSLPRRHQLQLGSWHQRQPGDWGVLLRDRRETGPQ